MIRIYRHASIATSLTKRIPEPLVFLTWLAILLLSAVLYGQIGLSPSPLAQVESGAVAWGDYDNDGDLDILLTGTSDGSSGISKIYRNDGGKNDQGVFTEVTSLNLTGVFQSAVAWGDYDGDNDLDILLTGTTGDGLGISRIYRNDNGTFVDIGAALAGVFQGAVAWGDYDNDGDLDILLSGTGNGADALTQIYRNDSGNFVAVTAGLDDVFQSAAAWSDYDGDGDLDLVLTGTPDGLGGISKIYRNENGTFTDIAAALTGVFQGSVAWGDFDNDGDPDLLLTGTPDGSSAFSEIYRNDEGNFNGISAGLDSVYQSAAAWGDFDVDGDLDIVLTGTPDGSTGIYKYFRNQNGTFEERDSYTGFVGSTLAGGDFDKDGDLDIVLAGLSDAGEGLAGQAQLVPTANVYFNVIDLITGRKNQKPSAPGGLSSTPENGGVRLSWSASTDMETPSTALTYNLRAGTSPGGSNVASAMADGGNGFRKLPATGNTGHLTGWQLNLPDGTYYWSVQAIDHGYAGSDFAAEGRFTLGSNQPPEVINAIRDQTLYVNGPSFTRNLEASPVIFSDPEGDPLSYSASSSDEAVASVSVSGSSVTVSPLSEGPAVITVLASDGHNNTVPTTFNITVISGSNEPPVVENAIPDTNLVIEGAAFVRDLNAAPAVFSDPEGDSLSYTAIAEEGGIVTVSIAGSVLNVAPLAKGAAVVTVTANDGHGNNTSTTFTVTVKEGGNNPPVVENTIRDQILYVDGPSFTRNLEASPVIFSDPEGDPLSYSVSSSDEAVASVSVSGSSVTVSPVSAGNALITVTADDGQGNSTPTTFDVTVQGGSNEPPVVANTIRDQILYIDGPSFTRNLEASPVIFIDPEGDVLTYTASSSDPLAASATVAGGSVTVSPLSEGTAVITVTANDGNGNTTPTTFNVTVQGGSNEPPAVANAIRDQILYVDGPSFTRNLEASPVIFSDPEGDSLSYTALSSNSAVAEVEISGSSVVVSPVSEGTAVITVSANDGNGNTTPTTFNVTVQGGSNEPPVVENAIPDTSLVIEGAVFVRDLNAAPAVFSDPEGDLLSYTAIAAEGGIVTVSIAGSVLSVAPLAKGAAVVRVTANDGHGNSTPTSFTVMVTEKPQNRPPVVADTIPNQSLIAGGRAFTRDLNADPPVFNDPDGDELSYTTESDNTSAATASLAGSVLTVTPLSMGNATIMVTADDGNGHTVPTQFNVSVLEDSLPVITIGDDVPEETDEENEIPITVTVSDGSGVSRVTLFYRRGGDLNFTRAEMTESTENTYEARIPANVVTSRGVDYYVEAENVLGFIAQKPPATAPFPYFSIQVRVADLSRGTSQPSGSGSNAYRLISVPIDVDSKSPGDVLFDELGAYDDTRWRFFDLQQDQQYHEYPNTRDMSPGRAFWLIVEESGKVLGTGAGTSNRTDEEFLIPLHAAWNFVGVPFNFAIPVEKIRFQNSQAQPEIRAYNGAWNDPMNNPVTVLQPFEGYAVFNSSSSADNLVVNPNLAPVSSTLAESNAANQAAAGAWAVRILAQIRDTRDADNLALAVSGALAGYDPLDRPEPPVIGEYVSAYFHHPEWPAVINRFRTDARPQPLEGDHWTFEVKTNIADQLYLTFEGVREIPPPFEVWLIDRQQRITQNLREDARYRYESAGRERPRQFELLIGTPAFLEKAFKESQLLPRAFELSQNYPNPFNPTTTIGYGLPAEEQVTLKIYNILGQEIITLVDDDKRPAGYHQVTWNGKDPYGNPVASGIYIYELRSGGLSLRKKMILMK